MDVTVDLCTGTYQRFKKVIVTHTYIKELPDSTSKRISSISSINQHLAMLHPSIKANLLEVGKKKILLVKKTCYLQIE